MIIIAIDVLCLAHCLLFNEYYSNLSLLQYNTNTLSN